ncbi:MAG: Ig-like domain repeat protein, partial [Candidatus Colwellbacteria bacterium]|nr:Ig-like domain repeat protein [Candidatus Colwellbacteria bacterium]
MKLRINPLGSVFSAFTLGVVLCGSIFLGTTVINKALAADGSGTNTVNPTTVTPSSVGNTFTFTYTASETLDSGGIKIAVPAGGWSVPQGNNGVAGYTTASSTGTIADVKNNLDTSTGWAVTNHMTLSADTGDKQEGSASLSNAITSQAAANEQWYFNYGSTESWGQILGSTNLKVGMWLKSSITTSAGDLSWRDDNMADLPSPLDTIAIPALTANTWEYVSVTLGATSRTSILSYGFRYTNDIGSATVKADDISVIFHAADSNNGWSGDSGITDSLITGSGNFKEGTGAVRCTYAGSAGTGSNGDCFDSEMAVRTIGPGTTVNFWVRSSAALNAGDFAFTDDDSSNVSSPIDIIDLPAISANTWTYVSLIAPSSGTMRSFGVRQLVDKGAMTIDLDGFSKEIDSCDSTTGWITPTSSVQALSTDNGVFHEGTGSLKNIITTSATAGDKWYSTLGVSENWSGYTTAGFWIRSTVATTAGQLKFEYASSSDLTSPIASINIGALAANTWTYQKLTLTGTRTSVLSYGVNYAVDIGAATVYLDDVLLGPGNITFSGNDINARLLSLSGTQTVTVIYGNGGGISGVTAPATQAPYTFTTSSRNSDSGTLTNIAISPVITVSLPATTTSVATSGSPSVYGDSVTFTATVTPAGGGAPTGDVTFKDGLTTIGTGTLNGANPGVATLNISTLSVLGSPHSITAVYAGDSGHSGSTSSAITQNVTAKALTVTGITASDKIYDRFTTATLNVASAALVGVISPDSVTLNTGSAVGTFDTKDVGVGKTVTVSGLTITGTDSGN